MDNIRINNNSNNNDDNRLPLKSNKMGTVPVGRLLAGMSWPAIFSMMINALYNIVDSIFVSMISEDALTAVTLAFPIQMFLISLAVGTGVGTNSLISRRLGAKRFDEANKAAEHSLRLTFVNWSIFVIFGIFFARKYMTAYSDVPFIIENGTIFLQIVTIGSLFSMVAISIEKILQATGNMVLPMICSLCGAVTNIALNPILVLGLLGAPKLGVMGAAIATITGQILNMVLALIVFFKVDKTFQIRVRKFKIEWHIIRDIYAVGLPSIIMQSIGSVMLIGFNTIIVKYKTAIAVLGAYFRLQSFVFMPVFGLTQGAMPIMGYNYGARDKERLMRTFKVSFLAALVYITCGFIVFQMFPDKLLSVFSASPEMLRIGVPALKMISLCFIPAAFGIVASTLFQATGHGVISLFASLIRQILGILPLAWFLMQWKGISAIWMSFPLAELMGVAFAAIMLIRLYKTDISRLAEEK